MPGTVGGTSTVATGVEGFLRDDMVVRVVIEVVGNFVLFADDPHKNSVTVGGAVAANAHGLPRTTPLTRGRRAPLARTPLPTRKWTRHTTKVT